MLQLVLEAPSSLDLRDPLQQNEDGLEDVISANGLHRASTTELLSVLPHQCHSVEDGLLKLSFFHEWKNVPNPLSISLHIDAAPGCGGLAWPAGQVHFFFLSSFLLSIKETGSCQLLGSKGT